MFYEQVAASKNENINKSEISYLVGKASGMVTIDMFKSCVFSEFELEQLEHVRTPGHDLTVDQLRTSCCWPLPKRFSDI